MRTNRGSLQRYWVAAQRVEGEKEALKLQNASVGNVQLLPVLLRGAFEEQPQQAVASGLPFRASASSQALTPVPRALCQGPCASPRSPLQLMPPTLAAVLSRACPCPHVHPAQEAP